MILYLHGFRSSPQSFKARALQAWMSAHGRAAQFCCPALSASPAQAIAQAEALMAGFAREEISIIGSSLGGFYATWLAEKYGCRAVLVNPAVQPPRDLESYVGVSTCYHSEELFEFKAEYVEQLRALSVAQISAPQRYFLIAATGDEVLDWRDMVQHYAGARHLIIPGSDHGIAEMTEQFAEVLAFCDAPHA